MTDDMFPCTKCGRTFRQHSWPGKDHDFSPAACECVSRMDTSACPKHGGRNTWLGAPEFAWSRLFDQRDAAIERLRGAEDRVAALLCERHQPASPTRQPCAACVQDAHNAVGGAS